MTLKDIAVLVQEPTGDAFLDDLFDRVSSAVYYRFFYQLVKITHPALAVELGAYRGGCSAHLAAADQNLRVVCIDPDPQPEFDSVLKRYPNIDFKKDSSLSRAVLNSIEDGSVDLCFIDTDHYHDQLLCEFALWLPKMKSSGIIFFDDINLDDTMRLAWKHLQEMCPQFRWESLPELHHSGFGACIL